jgi:superfamily II DNA or RNA helicase
MEYAKGYPCLYGMEGETAINVNGAFVYTIKNGSTWHIANRKSGAKTYFPKKPSYSYVVVLSKASFTDQDDLYILDAEFVDFMKENNLGNYYINEGGGTEWFLKSCPQSYLELRKEFLARKNIPILAVIMNDPYPIYDLSEEDKKLDGEEQMKIVGVKQSVFNHFISVFLPTNPPRRIQSEVWYLFQKICETSHDIVYKGIIQWPTGTGKTIAMLMLIVLAAERCKHRGKIYRGLLISPKNDIFDTIAYNFKKLSEFGITICDGSHGKLSVLDIPKNEHVLIMACHQALTNNQCMRRLPTITHVHYDEVHRIGGDELHTLLQEMLKLWKTEILTGTSATPKTCSPSQHLKLKELFGEPYTILHKCGVDEAVKEGWIARPRFIVHIGREIDDTDAHLRGFLKAIKDVIKLKGRGGKYICYIETSIVDVRDTARIAMSILPEAKIYTAIDGERTDNEFITAAIDETPNILFACQRYREGSDIKGLEMTAKLAGSVMAAHTIIQIQGRALRLDYASKEGWCLIYRPSPEGTTSQDVLDSIILDIIEFIGEKKNYEKKDIERFVEMYMGSITLDGTICSTSETVERVQAAYLRKEYMKRTPKEKYSLVRQHNKDLGLNSKTDYHENKGNHPIYIEDPRSYFKDWWVSWYEFLGVDTSAFPNTKTEWVCVCKERGILTWEQYKTTAATDLPTNPSEFYEDFTNWDKEMGIEEEVIW